MSDPHNRDSQSVQSFDLDDVASQISSFASDRYRIERVLGRGGMAYVLLATDSVLGRKVAIKVPQFKSNRPNEDTVKRLLREAKAAAGLSHPNICPVYDVEESDGNCLIAMGYVEGCLLSQAIEETERFEEAEVAQVIRKIASGADEAHRQGILHRDLKPSNIMIDRRGEPIILDFGLARFFNNPDTDPTLTQTGQALGTPAYMSPEQATGQRELSPTTDIFSLGVIMWEMLCGERPFQGDTLVILGQIVHGVVPSPRMKRPGISVEMEAICLKAMARNPDERFQSMQQFEHALDDVLEGRELSIDLTRFAADRRGQDTLDLRVAASSRTPPMSQLPPDDDTAVERPALARIIRHPLFSVWIALGVILILLAIIIAGRVFGPPPPDARPSAPRHPAAEPPDFAGAPPEPGQLSPPRPDMTVDDVLAEYDQDGNGRLDAEEFFPHIMDRVDANGDGVLDRQELDDGFREQGSHLWRPPEGREGPPGEREGRPGGRRPPGGRPLDGGPPGGPGRPRGRRPPPGEGPDGFGPRPERPPRPL